MISVTNGTLCCYYPLLTGNNCYSQNSFMENKKQTKGRAWTFTLFQLDAFQEEKLKRTASLLYMVWQQEKCPKTERMHYQGYVHFQNPRTLRGVRRLIGGNPHLEIARGTPQQNKDYCTKAETREDGPWEFGTIPKQGNRVDVISMFDDMHAGKSTKHCLENHTPTFFRYSGAYDRVRFLLDQEETRTFRKLEVHVLVGPTGTGKTRYVVEKFSPDVYVLPRPNGQSLWFDGYQGEKTLLIDEFYGWMPWGVLLQCLDGYQQRLPIKRSFTWAKWTRVYITSNTCPRQWYREDVVTSTMFAALERRITKTHRFGCTPFDECKDSGSRSSASDGEWNNEDIRPTILVSTSRSQPPVI